MGSVSITFDPDAMSKSPKKRVLTSGTRGGSRAQAIIHATPDDDKRLRCSVLRQQDDVERDLSQDSRTAEKQVRPRCIKRRRGSTTQALVLQSDRAHLNGPRRHAFEGSSRWGPPTPTSVPLSGLDILISGCGLFPHDLSALTTIYHAVVALDLIRSDPSQFPELVTHRGPSKDSSYFAYVGPRFGSSDCLDNALRCLFSKTRSILAPSSAIPEAVILSQYDQALASLQAAVNSPNWADPEVLCATSILALFEVRVTGVYHCYTLVRLTCP